MNDSVHSNVESGVQTAKKDPKPKYCAKCQNHGILELVRGHKRHCRFKFCTCVKCLYTDMKRKNVATKVQLQRELKQEQEKAARLKKELKRKLDERVKSEPQDSVMPKPASSPAKEHPPITPTKVSELEDEYAPWYNIIEEFTWPY